MSLINSNYILCTIIFFVNNNKFEGEDYFNNISLKFYLSRFYKNKNICF